MTSPLPTPPLPTRNVYSDALGTPARVLGEAVLHATRSIEHTIALAFHHNNSLARSFASSSHPNVTKFMSDTSTEHHRCWTSSQLAVLQEADTRLSAARDSAKETLKEVFYMNLIDQQQSEFKLPQDARNCILAMIALLQVGELVFLTYRCLMTSIDGT
jgi:hypothetical protein